MHLHVAERGRSFRPSMSGSRTDPICRGDDSSRPPAPGCPPPPPAPGCPASRRPRQWSRDLSVGLLKPIGFPLVKQMSPLRADGCQPSGRHDLCSIRAATTARQAGHVERRRRGAEPASDLSSNWATPIGHADPREASPLRPSVRRDFGRSDLYSLETASLLHYRSCRADPDRCRKKSRPLSDTAPQPGTLSAKAASVLWIATLCASDELCLSIPSVAHIQSKWPCPPALPTTSTSLATAPGRSSTSA